VVVVVPYCCVGATGVYNSSFCTQTVISESSLITRSRSRPTDSDGNQRWCRCRCRGLRRWW
jgi:hypothetical protein